MNLSELPFNIAATIDTVDWPQLSERDGRRLRELGFDEGVSITALHAGGLVGRDPIAVRVGRMTVAIRRSHAVAIGVEPVA